MLGEFQILQVLREHVEQARSRHELAKAAFWSIAADPQQLPPVPNGRPQPDGSHKIREAFRAEAEARVALLDAVHRFSDLLVSRRPMARAIGSADTEPDGAARSFSA